MRLGRCRYSDRAVAEKRKWCAASQDRPPVPVHIDADLAAEGGGQLLATLGQHSALVTVVVPLSFDDAESVAMYPPLRLELETQGVIREAWVSTCTGADAPKARVNPSGMAVTS